MILAVVENPRAVVAVVAVPVRFPMTFPVRFPTKVVAVTIPNTFVLPITSSFTVGCVEPIPILVLEYTKSDAPAKSPLLALYGIEFTFPGPTKSVTEILTVAIPVCCVTAAPTKSTVTPVPTKLNLLKLFAAPT